MDPSATNLGQGEALHIQVAAVAADAVDAEGDGVAVSAPAAVMLLTEGQTAESASQATPDASCAAAELQQCPDSMSLSDEPEYEDWLRRNNQAMGSSDDAFASNSSLQARTESSTTGSETEQSSTPMTDLLEGDALDAADPPAPSVRHDPRTDMQSPQQHSRQPGADGARNRRRDAAAQDLPPAAWTGAFKQYLFDILMSKSRNGLTQKVVEEQLDTIANNPAVSQCIQLVSWSTHQDAL